MVSALINPNPVVYKRSGGRDRDRAPTADEYAEEPIDVPEIFNHIRDIQDPEHPHSLEELRVVTEESIEVDDKQSYLRVTFTPTVKYCTMATTIGLCLHAKLMRSLPTRYKVNIRVAPGSHATEVAGTLQFPLCGMHSSLIIQVPIWLHHFMSPVNKQMADKERVAAALEIPNVARRVEECLAPTFV